MSTPSPAPVLPTIEIPKAARRKFSQRLVMANCAMAWLAIAFATWCGAGPAEIVVPTCGTLIAWLVGSYMGIGHLDLRTAASAAVVGAVGAVSATATAITGARPEGTDCDPAPSETPVTGTGA